MKTTATPTGTTMIDDSLCAGIAPQADGTFLALTPLASKPFRSAKGATAWLARRGYGPTGTRLAAPATV
jgi:hypothetical protein